MATPMAAYRQSGDHSQEEGEKYGLERTSVSSDAPLNKDDEDVEAQMATTAQTPPAQPLEYSTSTTKKLVFLTLYFFLSLGLTLSNKALMKTVSTLGTSGLVDIKVADMFTGQTSMASHSIAHRFDLCRMFYAACQRTAQAVEIRHEREPRAGRIFYAIYAQHCD
jgi:hypothetical protein